jgi:secreted PhoX family phosphatase
MTHLSRRELFRSSAKTGAAITLGGAGVSLLQQLPAGALPATGFGPLLTDPAHVIDLPSGFSYKVLAAGDSTAAWALPRTYLDDVLGAPSTVVTPNKADGGAAFDLGGGRIAVVVNCEADGDAAGFVPKDSAMIAAAAVYNAAGGNVARGGTTTLELDTNVLDADGFPTVVRHYASIAGTIKNCAGGATPWGTWFTCEETDVTRGSVRHGYNFEVDPHGVATTAVPYTAMGRFAHEAVVVDPATGTVYQTEDASGPRGLVYKFVPTDTSGTYGSLGNGGALFAMACSQGGVHVPDLKLVSTPGTVLQVTWKAVPNSDPDIAGGEVRVRMQFADGEVTRARKYEGMWWGDGDAWIISSYSDDGDAFDHQGQVWRYNPVAETLTLVFHAAVGDEFNGPDNIVVTPHGGAILCEDGDNANKLLVGIAGQGPDYGGWAFARNMYNGSEFAGATFSPDGKVLFVNLYAPSAMLAITGPWLDVAPDPVVPEVPVAALLPVTAGAALAGAVWLRNRRAGEAVAR